jgi:hypothetical protein
MTIEDEELISKARELLDKAQLSGASIEFLDHITDGIVFILTREERRRIKELCLIHQI